MLQEKRAIGNMLDKNKIMITAIKDPLDPYRDRYIQHVDFENKSVFEYMKMIYPLIPEDIDVVASINGQKVKDIHNSFPLGGTNLVFCIVPKGGNTWKKVAVIAVTIAAIYFAGPYGAQAGQGMYMGMFGAATYGTAGYAVAGYVGFAVAAGATLYAGGMLVNSILPPQTPDLPSFGSGSIDSESPTYAWQPLGNIQEEGKPWPVLYGRVRVFPYIINRYITSSSDDQYLYLLGVIADHAVDTISDGQVNDNEIEQYTEVTAAYRYGGLNQTVLPYFDNTYYETAEGCVIKYGSWSIRDIGGASIQGIIVGIVFPNGLVYFADDGTEENASVTLHIQYRPQSGGVWYTLFNDVITRATYETVRISYSVSGLSMSSYEIQASLTVDPPTGAKYRNKVHLEYTQGVFYDDFSYPGTSLVALEILATDQISGATPRFSFLVERTYVSVYTGSTWENKPANNPAWACYDMHVNSDYGAGVDHNRMIYADFLDWADFCDENGYECNMYFDSFQSFNNAINTISTIGRASVVQKGTNFGVVIDRVDTPVQLFGVGNIIADTFDETFLGRTDRANVIEISYFDAEKDYARQTFELRTATYDTDIDIEEKKIQIVLYACTDKTMAIRYGQFLLNCNGYLIRTVSFETGVDSLASEVGDVIYVSHDVPQWGYSGRVINARLNTIQIDREVTLSVGVTYHILVRHSDDDSLEEVAIQPVSVETTTSFLRIDGVFSQIPLPEDVYAFGEVDEVSKLFRIVSLTRTQEMRRKITALEYREEVYDDERILPWARVLTPVITPESGVYYTFVTVTITCETVSATIYYTTDGSTPTEESNEYVTPFEVLSSKTVKAKAFKEGWVDSDITIKVYELAEWVSVFDNTRWRPKPISNLQLQGTWDGSKWVSSNTWFQGGYGTKVVLRDLGAWVEAYRPTKMKIIHTGNNVYAGISSGYSITSRISALEIRATETGPLRHFYVGNIEFLHPTEDVWAAHFDNTEWSASFATWKTVPNRWESVSFGGMEILRLTSQSSWTTGYYPRKIKISIFDSYNLAYDAKFVGVYLEALPCPLAWGLIVPGIPTLTCYEEMNIYWECGADYMWGPIGYGSNPYTSGDIIDLTTWTYGDIMELLVHNQHVGSYEPFNVTDIQFSFD
jgi:hypothetical protein